MTYITFVRKNAFRNPKRTALTVLSIGASLLLLIVLTTILDMLMNPKLSDESALRLAVRRSTSLADQMPVAYLEKVRRIPNVKVAMPLQWFGGQYIKPENFFANFACDPEIFFDMYPEVVSTPGAPEKFKSQKDAALVGVDLMSKFGWKIGQKVTLKGTIFPVDLEFEIVGDYRAPNNRDAFYFRYDYMNQALGEPNTVGAIWVMVAGPDDVPVVAEKIDAAFANSPAETKTETEKAFVLGFVSMLGDVQSLIGSVGIVVVFTMLLVSASTMAMTIRERTREVGVLKALGYPRGTVLRLILGESVFLGLLGVVLAAGSAAIFMIPGLLTSLTMGFVQEFMVSPTTFAGAAAVGLGIGFFSGLFPALQASRLTITEAIKSIE